MQITLVQTEIEEAIRNYVTSQINVNDDQQIDIDLKATRGADGYQAMIDIRQKGARRSSSARVQVTETAAKAEKAPIAATETVAAPSAPKTATATVKRRGRPPKAAATPTLEVEETTPVVEPEVQEANVPNEANPESMASLANTVEYGEAETAPETEAEPAIEDGDQTVADIAAEKPVEEPAKEAPRTSLFANLKTPVNA